MRRSYLLLAFVAGATAGNIARSRQSVERDVALNSRDATEISQSVEARIAPDEKATVGLRSRQRKRDDDPYDDYKEHLKHIQELQEQAQDHDDDDDDDDSGSHNDSDPGPPRGPPGGTIAGAVIGVVVAILIALALWYFLRIRPRRKQRQQTAAKEAELEGGYAMTPVSTIHNRSAPTTGGTASNGSLPPSEHIRWAPTPYPERAPSIHTGSSMSGLALPTPALTYSPSVGGTSASSPSPPSPQHYHQQYQLQPQHPQQHQQQQYQQYEQQQQQIHPQAHPHFNDIPSEKPPSYDAVTALQSSEPQPEASAYQLGQVPVESEPEPMICHMPASSMPPQYGAANTSGEHMPRY